MADFACFGYTVGSCPRGMSPSHAAGNLAREKSRVAYFACFGHTVEFCPREILMPVFRAFSLPIPAAGLLIGRRYWTHLVMCSAPFFVSCWMSHFERAAHSFCAALQPESRCCGKVHFQPALHQ